MKVNNFRIRQNEKQRKRQDNLKFKMVTCMMTDFEFNSTPKIKRIQSSLLPKDIFHQRSSSITRHHPSRGIFFQCDLSQEATLHQSSTYERSSFIKGCLPRKVIFHGRLSPIKAHLPSNIVFHRGCFSLKSVYYQSKVNAKSLSSKIHCTIL